MTAQQHCIETKDFHYICCIINVLCFPLGPWLQESFHFILIAISMLQESTRKLQGSNFPILCFNSMENISAAFDHVRK